MKPFIYPAGGGWRHISAVSRISCPFSAFLSSVEPSSQTHVSERVPSENTDATQSQWLCSTIEVSEDTHSQCSVSFMQRRTMYPGLLILGSISIGAAFIKVRLVRSASCMLSWFPGTPCRGDGLPAVMCVANENSLHLQKCARRSFNTALSDQLQDLHYLGCIQLTVANVIENANFDAAITTNYFSIFDPPGCRLHFMPWCDFPPPALF